MSIWGTVVGFITGSGIGWFVLKAALKASVKELMNEELSAINQSIAKLKKGSKDEDQKLHNRIDAVEKNYITCEYCKKQNENTERMFDSIDHKLDLLLDHNMK